MSPLATHLLAGDAIGPPPGPPGPTQTQTYTVDSTTDFVNPERGWYLEHYAGQTWGSRGHPTPVSYHQSVTRLAMRYVRLDDYRFSAIPQGLLDDLAAEMATWRNTSVKCVLRFAYNRSRTDDAPFSRVIEHIGQLAPLWAEYQDVIAVLQAGFIGQWGEWHTSSNNLISGSDSNGLYRNQIWDALMSNTPASMMVENRYPWIIASRYGRYNPLTEAERFTGTARARSARHNDSWVANQHMGGTYAGWDPPFVGEPEAERAYDAAILPYLSHGGETSDVGSLDQWNDGPYSIDQKVLLHLDYLNSEFYKAILEKWHSSGHLAEISRRLGYRIALTSVTAPTTVTPGAPMSLTVSWRNDGFGKVFNPRPVDVVFTGSGGPFTARATADARRILPLAGEAKQSVLSATVPAGLQAGQSYALALKLPDPSTNLEGNPNHAIRFANGGGVWEGLTGLNTLGLSVTVPS
jgi:hypothetical protein